MKKAPIGSAAGLSEGATVRLVLASASPRRSELLRSLGAEVTIRPVVVDETRRPGEPAREYTLRLAREKAAKLSQPGEIVIGADTIVVLDSKTLFGKPSSPVEARRMLQRLAGRQHSVFTAVAIIRIDANGTTREATDVSVSHVHMKPLTKAEIDWYVATGEPLDKAGAYALQGLGGMFAISLVGEFTNVVGLPLCTVSRLAHELGFPLGPASGRRPFEDRTA